MSKKGSSLIAFAFGIGDLGLSPFREMLSKILKKRIATF
jgi:hypothetical protein